MPRGVMGFFHYNLQWIHAEAGSIVGLAKSHYINRHEGYAVEAPESARSMREKSVANSAGLSDYINRNGDEANPELGHYLLITRDLPVRDGAGLARLLDARERKQDRTYRQYGGRMPRVGCHGIVSFQWGISDEAAVDALTGHARMISDRLRVPIEGRIHYKAGRPDHAHILLGTRIVEHGHLGRKQRQLDAVSEKADGRGLVADDRVLGSTLEFLRADWAERMRQASGDGEIDHRSYRRRGLPVYPVTHIPRSEIEYQKRRNSEAWRTQRSEELAIRTSTSAAAVVDQASRIEPIGIDIEASVESGSAQSMHQGVDGISPRQDIRRKRDRDGVGASGPAHDHAIGPPATAISARLRPVVEVYQEFQRAHRLTSDREAILAATAGVDVAELKRAAADALGHERELGAARPVEARPSDLLKLVCLWQEEDRRARAGRRREKRAGSGTPVTDCTVTTAAGNIVFREEISNLDWSRLDPPAAVSPASSAGLDCPCNGPNSASAAPHNDRRTSAIAAHIELSRRHRLTAEREGILGEVAGFDVAELRRAAELETASSKLSDRSRSAVSPELWSRPVAQLWLAWVAEDRAARAERRREGGRRPDSEISAAVATPCSQAAPLRSVDSDTADGSPDRAAQLAEQPLQEGTARLKPTPSAGDPIPVPDVTAGPGAIAGSEALARAVVDAHVDDIIARAYDANRPPLSDGELRRAVALRLRASEYDRAEIALTLRGRHLAGGLPGDIEVDRAVDEAFSDRSTTWLDARAGFCARAAQVSHRAEMATYRRLRNEALAHLQRDLDDVWRTRRADLDCVMAWHRRDMAWIRDLRWRNRRLRSRGLILAILSLAVELAVLRPLQALEKTITAQERRELDDAAKAATTRLRALREEWRTARGVVCRLPVRQDNRSAPQDKMTVGTSPDPARVDAYSANAHHRPRYEASSPHNDRRIERSNGHSSVLDGEPSSAVASLPSAAGTAARASVFEKNTDIEHPGTPPVSTLAPLAAAVPLQAAPVPEPDRSIPSGTCKPANPRTADEPSVAVPPTVGPTGTPQGRSETAVPIRVDAPLPYRKPEPKPIPDRGDGRLAELAANRGGDDRSISDRRRLVVDYGLVLAAHGAWSSKRSAYLAALIGATPDALWKMVHRRCWERYGRNAPSAIDEADKQALRRDTWRSSKAIKFEDLLRVMTISMTSPRDRGRRDDD